MKIDEIIKEICINGVYNEELAKKLYKKDVDYRDLAIAKWLGFIKYFPQYKDTIINSISGRIYGYCGYCFEYNLNCYKNYITCPMYKVCDNMEKYTPNRILKILIKLKGVNNENR